MWLIGVWRGLASLEQILPVIEASSQLFKDVGGSLFEGYHPTTSHWLNPCQCRPSIPDELLHLPHQEVHPQVCMSSMYSDVTACLPWLCTGIGISPLEPLSRSPCMASSIHSASKGRRLLSMRRPKQDSLHVSLAKLDDVRETMGSD